MKQSPMIETAMIAAVITHNRLEEIQAAQLGRGMMDAFSSIAAVAKSFYETFKDVEEWETFLHSDRTPHKASDWEEFICWYTDKSLPVLHSPFAISYTCYEVGEAAHLLNIDFFRADAQVFVCDQTGLWIECCENSHCWTEKDGEECTGEWGQCIAFFSTQSPSSSLKNGWLNTALVLSSRYVTNMPTSSHAELSRFTYIGGFLELSSLCKASS